MSRKALFVFLALVICSFFTACNPSPKQMKALTTQIAGEIFSTQTESVKQTQSIPTAAESKPTATPTLSPTPTEIALELEALPIHPVSGLTQGTDGYPWWNDTVFYEIFIRSFYDSDGDGIGDLNGITQKLDYLNDGDAETSTDLGITGIWLMPFYPSPSYHGYNVMDYFDINPEYGTMEDFIIFLESAHERGIRVIIDLVINHTSYLHPWFIEAGNPASPYHDWYIWSNIDPGYTGSWGQQVWFPHQGRYFYSTFSAGMPDLNYTNPDVTEQMTEVVRFWLENVGVDGFRIDAAKHIIEEGTIQANSDSTHEWWEEFRPSITDIDSEALILGEVWEDTEITAEYLQGDEFHLSFEFWLAGAMIESVNAGNAGKVNDQVILSYTEIPEMRFGTFLTNHDMDRVMSQLFDDDNKMKAAASLLLTAPGVPFIYYGEEIGMQGDQSHEWVRRPMQWSDDMNGGFSTGTPWQPLGPAWDFYNVLDELDDEDSILAHYQKLILIRNEHAALRVGGLDVLTTTDEAVYSILRVSEDESVLVMINIGDQPISDIWISKSQSSLPEGQYYPVPILGEGEFSSIDINEQGGMFYLVDGLEMQPYETMIFQLQKSP